MYKASEELELENFYFFQSNMFSMHMNVRFKLDRVAMDPSRMDPLFLPGITEFDLSREEGAPFTAITLENK